MEADSSSQTSKQPTKRSRHEIWGNFTEIEEMGGAKMRCNECQQLVAKYTTSMKSHWVKKHKDKNQPAKKIRSEVNSELSEPKDKYKRIQSALAATLSIPALPINSFLHPLMRKLFHSLNSNYELPRSFATLKKILLDQYVKTQSKMKADLSTMRQRFSITCDVWTDRGALGVTLHYSDQQAFLQRVFLGLKQLEGSHTSFVIRRETEKLLTEYGLNLSSAFKVVTDAGQMLTPVKNEFWMQPLRGKKFSRANKAVTFDSLNRTGDLGVAPEKKTWGKDGFTEFLSYLKVKWRLQRLMRRDARVSSQPAEQQDTSVLRSLSRRERLLNDSNCKSFRLMRQNFLGSRSTQVMGKYAKDGCEEYCNLGFGGSFHSGNECAY
uniref:BED-type domain-containing protein n=1 Tax=Ditylenchus dipsaci TaxID=166011 RepID=A0A915EIE9_9BILA